MSTNDYEAWVRALRAWAQDPTTDLAGLPALTLESFPAATYDRFITHLTEAVTAMMTAWAQDFSTRLGRASSPQEIARALVDARKGLARRLLLCDHPGLPEPIRQAMRSAARTDIVATQSELERGAGAVYGQVVIENVQRDRHLRLLRDNALTAVLAPGFPLADFVAGRAAIPAVIEPRSDAGAARLFDPAPRRRIVID